MKNLGEDVGRKRWKFIGQVMSKEPKSCCVNLDTTVAPKEGQTQDKMED